MKKEHLFLAIRIIFAACSAILLAETIGLRFSVSAGIVAILSVAATKQETLQTALARLEAFGCALAIAFVCFACIGATIPAFLVYLFLFIPLCLHFGWNSAMAMDSVLISHFLTFGGITADSLANELLIFAIGAGSGILVNLLLRSDSLRASLLTERLDEQIREALLIMAERIRRHTPSDSDHSCIVRLRSTADEALSLARSNARNRLFLLDDEDIRYITMRRRQIDTLEEMELQLRDLHITPDTAVLITDFLERTADEYARENSVHDLLNGYAQLEQRMKQRPLPADRAEFEARAALYAFMRMLKRFLEIKASYAQ